MVVALTILGEARNQPWAAKVAVGKTIANRMKEKGKSAADTALAPWQYSCWNPGDPNKLFLLETITKQAGNVQPIGLWEECIQAAEVALDPGAEDPTCGATHYTHQDIWGHDDSNRKKHRWFSAQVIADGITKELARLGSHVFGTTRW